MKSGLAVIVSAALVIGGGSVATSQAVQEQAQANETRTIDGVELGILVASYVQENYSHLVKELKSEYHFPLLQTLELPGIGYYMFGAPGNNGAVAYYNPDEGKILVSLFYNVYLGNDQKFHVGSEKAGTKNLDETLKHEFVHYYAHMLSRRMGLGRFPRDIRLAPADGHVQTVEESDTAMANYYLEVLKCEGISEALVPSSRRVHNFTDSMWPGHIKAQLEGQDGSINWTAAYPAAEEFVKPIIDRYGEAGIEAIISEPTSAEDINDIPGLRKRIMDRLDKKAPADNKNLLGF